MSQAGNLGSGGANPFGPLLITFVTGPTNYPVNSTDQFIAVDDTTASATITLPSTTTLGRLIIIKDRTGHATQFPISVTAGGVTTIDFQTTYIIAGNFGSISLLYDGLGNYEIW